MSSRRIVFLNDTSESRGGAAVLAVMAAMALAARGHEVIWLTGDSGDNPELAAAGIEVVALGGQVLLDLPARRAFTEGLGNRAAAAMVRDFVAERDTPETVYHVHAWSQIFSPAVFGALAPVAGRSFIHVHDLFLACPNGMFMDYRKDEVCPRTPLSLSCLATNCDKRSYAQKLWRVARTRALWRALGDFDRWGGILVIHPGMKPRLARAGFKGRNMFTLRNPVVPYSTSRIRAEDNRRLLYVGRLEADKGAGALAAAAARVGAALTLVGDGPQRGEIEALYPEAEIAGWVARAEIGAWAGRARALVMPSRHPEPFALVIAEATASGLPVLVADTALMAGEVIDKGLGFTFDSFDTGSIDGALRAIMALPDAQLRAMSERGFGGDARLGLDHDNWIDAIEDAYDRAVRA